MNEREKRDWMTLSQETINDLSIENWNHYKQGGCLCFAYCECECCCGAWAVTVEKSIEKRIKLERTNMQMRKPRGWRTGQTIFNFLEWLYGTGKAGPNQNARMADPFYISNEDWDLWWEEYQEQVGGVDEEN